MKVRPGRQQGTAIGIVTNLNDPEQYGRIQVRLPGVDDEVQSWWARISATQGGGSRGNFIRPEVGDEVLIMFEQGEPDQPIVVGVFWNGKDEPPGPGNADGKNDYKWIETRSGHQLIFNDGSDGGFIEFHDADKKLHTKFDVPGKHIRWTADSGFIRIEAPKGKVRFECTTFKLESSEKTDIQVTNTHTVSVTGKRSTSVSSGSLTQAAGSSMSVTTPQLSVSAQVLVAGVGGAGVNVGSVDATVKPKLSVEYESPVTRTVGQMSLKVGEYYQTNEGNPSGPLTLTGGNLKLDAKGAVLMKAGGGVTLNAGLVRMKGGQVNMAKDGGDGKSHAPGQMVNFLGGLLMLNPAAITMPATKMLDMMISADFHNTGAVPPAVPVPLFPFMGSGPMLLGFKPNVLINFLPAVGGGSIAVGMHVPPIPPPPLLPIPITFRGLAVAGLNALLTTVVSSAIEAVRGMVTANKASENAGSVERVGGEGENNPHFFKRMSDLLMTGDTAVSMMASMLPFPVFSGTIGIAAPTVQVGGIPAGLTSMPFALGCSDIPILPNAQVLGFSNVLVGVDLMSVLEQFVWNAIKGAASWLVGKAVDKFTDPKPNQVKAQSPADLDNSTQPLSRQNPPERSTTTGDPVDVITGARVEQEVELELPGALPLRLIRASNSVAASCRLGGGLGHGWRLTHESFLSLHRAQTIDGRPNSPLLNPEMERLRAASKLSASASAEDVERFTLGYWAWHTPDLRMVRLPLLKEDGEWFYDERERVEFCRISEGIYDLTDAQGLIWRFHCDEDGLLAWLVRCGDRHGNAWYVERDAQGFAEKILDSAGRVFALDHRESLFEGGRATRLYAIRLESIDNEPFPQLLCSYEYDERGHMVASTGPDGVRSIFRYDEQARVLYRGEADGYGWYWHYDVMGRVTQTYGEDLRYHYSLDYQPAANQTVVKDYQDRITRYTWEPETSQVTVILDPEGGVTTYAYDERGNRIEEVDASGRTTAWVYDERGRLVERTLPGGGVSAWVYDHRGWLKSHVDERGATTTWRHDAQGNAVQVRYPDGTETLTRYDEAGRPIAGIDRVGVAQEWVWNARGLLQTYTRGDQTAHYAYDELGRSVNAHFEGDALERALYGQDGRLNRLERPGRPTLRFDYDVMGRVAVETVGSKRTQLSHDGVGRVVERVSAAGRSLRSAYGLDDRPLWHEDHRGVRWVYTRDANDRLLSHEYAHIIDRYTRDAAGEILAVRTPDGATRSYVPSDVPGAFAQLTTSDGIEQIWLRDALGLPTEVTERSAQGLWAEGDPSVVKLLRNPLGQVIDELGPHGHVGRRFQKGQLVGYTLDGARIKIERDAHGEIQRVSTPWGAAQWRDGWLSLAEGAAVYQGLHGGVALSDQGVETLRLEILEEGEGRSRSRLERRVLEGRLFEQRAQLDLDGAPVDVQDILGQALGERLGLQGHQVLSDGAAEVAYDRCGRVTAKPQTGGVQRLSYDDLGRLSEVELPSGAILFYRYDAFGRLIERIYDPIDGPGEHTRLWWSGDRLAGWSDGQRTQRYLYLEPEALTPSLLVDETAAGAQLCALLKDDRGAVVGVIGAKGQVLWQADYSAFGEVRVNRSAIPQHLRLPGQWQCAHTQLVYNRFRWYEPAWGRYLTPDPLGIEGGADGYAYCEGNPYDYIDFLGLCAGTKAPSSAAPKQDAGGSPTAPPRSAGDTPSQAGQRPSPAGDAAPASSAAPSSAGGPPAGGGPGVAAPAAPAGGPGGGGAAAAGGGAGPPPPGGPPQRPAGQAPSQSPTTKPAGGGQAPNSSTKPKAAEAKAPWYGPQLPAKIG